MPLFLCTEIVIICHRKDRLFATGLSHIVLTNKILLHLHHCWYVKKKLLSSYPRYCVTSKKKKIHLRWLIELAWINKTKYRTWIKSDDLIFIFLFILLFIFSLLSYQFLSLIQDRYERYKQEVKNFIIVSAQLFILFIHIVSIRSNYRYLICSLSGWKKNAMFDFGNRSIFTKSGT